MTHASLSTPGVLLITVTAVTFGDLTLLQQIARRVPGCLDNPVHQNLWRAGHAHAGVLVLLARSWRCSTSTAQACQVA